MLDGTFDKAFLISEIERFTGVKVDIPENPGKVLVVIPEHDVQGSSMECDAGIAGGIKAGRAVQRSQHRRRVAPERAPEPRRMAAADPSAA